MPQVRAEAPDRGEEGGDIDDGRKHEQEHRVGRDLQARDAGNRAEGQSAQQKEHGVRDAQAPRQRHQSGDGHEEQEEELGRLHRAALGARHVGRARHDTYAPRDSPGGPRSPRAGIAGTGTASTGKFSAIHPARPPSSGRTRVIPRRLSRSATRALVASFGQEQ